MFTFCDVLHETKQKTQTNSRECAVRTGNHLPRMVGMGCGWRRLIIKEGLIMIGKCDLSQKYFGSF